MFHKWGFLLSEIWLLLALAALIGLLAGWIIWGRRASVAVPDTADADRLRAELASCTARGRELSGRVTALEADLAAAAARAMNAEASAKVGAAIASAAAPAPLAAMAAPLLTAPVMAEVAPEAAPEPAPQPAQVMAGETAKPQGLTAARGGKADDLKLVKGIGPKLELLCHKLGFYHFDQIANWTAAEIAWVDENLEGFKGRVTRDEWVVQARDLAAGQAPRPGGEG